jgi:predicted CXXCH cytochrome family protein
MNTPVADVPQPARRRWLRALLVVAALLAGGGAAVLAARWLWPGRAASVPDEELQAVYNTPFTNARPGVRYVGDEACAACHAEIAASYREHPMGRSLRPAAPPAPREPALSASFDKLGFHFSVEWQDGRMIHKAARLDAEGRPVVEDVADVPYALGSGRRGRSYLVERDGRLFQSPVSWFTQAGAWDLSPGFASFYPGERVIEPSCLFCHANRVEPVEQSRNHYRTPVFRGHAIGCERCHGPGELHVRQRNGEEFPAETTTIVNPGQMEPALREAVCEQCHLQGDFRIERRGRQTFDYRPGLPLQAFWAVFVRAPELGPSQKAVGHVEQMHASRCFRGSNGRLGCISCHDPHQLPDPGQRVAYYRGRCLSCHEDTRRCSLPAAARQEKGDDCAACHMPRYPSTNIAHTAVTDHRILRRADSPDGGARPRLPRPGELPLVNFFLERLSRDDPDADRDLGVALAYLDKAPGPFRDQMAALALPLLEKASARRPNDAVAGEARGWTLFVLGRAEEAAAAYQAVLQQVPRRELTLVLAAQAAERLERLDEALAYRRQLVELNPPMGEYRTDLARLLAQRGDWVGTLRQAEAALERVPANKEARRLVVLGCLRTGQPERAERELATLLVLSPQDERMLRKWFEQERQK